MNELVSVIMPSYNTASYIFDSIKSVLAQTYSNWELIIVDDCSTDNTDAIVAKFLSDKRIRYYKNPYNSGAAQSRNRALREAKGRYIAFLDSDDLWLPEKLEKQIRFMQKNGFYFTYSCYEEIDEKNKLLGIKVSGPKVITEFGMYNFCYPGCLTVIYDAQKIGLIQIADIKKNNDYAIWLKAIRKCNCYLLDEVLSQYRKRKGSISNHSYIRLIKHHYKLYRVAEKKSCFISCCCTGRNLIFGVYKKIRFVR